MLPEVTRALRAAGVPFGRGTSFEIMVDGGVRRGSDIFKAVALGASAVGVGRPVLYALASYGQAGVERMVRLLKDELTMVMRLMGTPTVADIGPSHVLTRNLGDHFAAQAGDGLARHTYEPLRTQATPRSRM